MAARQQSSAAAAAGPTARATNRPLHRVPQEGRARRRAQVAVRDSVRGRWCRPRLPVHAFVVHVCDAAGRHPGQRATRRGDADDSEGENGRMRGEADEGRTDGEGRAPTTTSGTMTEHHGEGRTALADPHEPGIEKLQSDLQNEHKA
jgi:hypothetical protein